MTPARLRTRSVGEEPAARRGLRLLLERDPEVEIVGEAESGSEAVARIRADRPDLVFLDVQMPEMNGFQVVAATQVLPPPAVVFVTAYDRHALQAFEINAVDYLLKPYEDARLVAALDRAKGELRHRRDQALGPQLTSLLTYLQRGGAATDGTAAEVVTSDRILLKSGGEFLFLKAEEIDWIEAEGDYMKFHAGGRAHLLRETMARLEERLDSRRFIRIHRSTIVNIDRVRKLSPTFAGEYAVVLQDGTKLRLSRGYHERMQELLKQAL
jgi:two-component system LytT family response regulator